MTDSLKKLLKIYLEDAELLCGEINMRAGKVANDAGVELHVNDENLDRAIRLFQTNCLPYWAGLGVVDPSHLKIFGHLLHSLTQSRDAEGERIVFFGIHPDEIATLSKDNKPIGAFFHEFCSFTAVHTMLCSAQRRRRIGLNFDPLKPPTSPRYVRSMISYLREWPGGPLRYDKTPYDFYMIFKSMDLYGLTANTDPLD